VTAEAGSDRQDIKSTGRSLVNRVVIILLFGVITGIAASFVALGFVDIIDWLADELIGKRSRSHPGFNLVLLLIPVAGGLLVGLLIRLTSDRTPDNVASLIFRAQIRARPFSLRDGAINALAAIAGMASGASVGIYGPVAALGATLASHLSRFCRIDITTAIGSGVAAAISTAFSAPIAGILFAHEVILRHYSLRAFAPITVASCTGFFISNYLLERPPLFQVEATRSLFAPEYFAFVVIGIAGALIATLLMKSIITASRIARQSNVPVWLRPSVAGLGVGLMVQWLPDTVGVGTDLISTTVHHDIFSLPLLTAMLLGKIVLTALCIGFGYVGGVFSPALVVGVLSGAIMGQLGLSFFTGLSSGLAFYSVCGMLAVTSPVIGGPLTAILIVFELTRNYELTTAVMISVAFSNLVAYRLFGRSLFDRQLASQGIDLSLGRDKVMLQRTAISRYVTTDAVTVKGSQRLIEAQRAMVEAGRQECYVLDELSRFVGKLRLSDIVSIPANVNVHQAIASDYASLDTLVFDHELSVWHALEQMREFVGESIAIIDQRNYFIGVIYQSTLVTAYLQTTENVRAEEHAAY